MQTPTKKTRKTRIHDNWLAGYRESGNATKPSKKSPKKKYSKTKSKGKHT